MKSLVVHNRPSVGKQSPYTVLFVCVALLGFLILLASQWRSRQTIKGAIVVGAVLLDEKEILDRAAIAVDSLRMAEVDLQEARERVAEMPFVKHAAVSMQAGEIVVITIEERIPVASILMENGAVQYVGADGVILPYRFTSHLLDLPFLAGFVHRGHVDTLQLMQGIGIITALEKEDKKLYKNISEITTRPGGGFVLRTTDGAVPIFFGDAEDIDRKVEKLRTYWNTQVFRGDIPDVRYIDLRWQNQVVIGSKNNS